MMNRKASWSICTGSSNCQPLSRWWPCKKGWSLHTCRTALQELSSAPHPCSGHTAPSLPGECGLGGEDKAVKLCHCSWNIPELKEEQSQVLQAGFSKVCFIPVVWKCQAKITAQSFVLTGEKKKRFVLQCSSLSGVWERQAERSAFKGSASTTTGWRLSTSRREAALCLTEFTHQKWAGGDWTKTASCWRQKVNNVGFFKVTKSGWPERRNNTSLQSLKAPFFQESWQKKQRLYSLKNRPQSDLN